MWYWGLIFSIMLPYTDLLRALSQSCVLCGYIRFVYFFMLFIKYVSFDLMLCQLNATGTTTCELSETKMRRYMENMLMSMILVAQGMVGHICIALKRFPTNATRLETFCLNNVYAAMFCMLEMVTMLIDNLIHKEDMSSNLIIGISVWCVGSILSYLALYLGGYVRLPPDATLY